MTEPISVKTREAVALTGLSERRIRDAVRAGELEVRYPYKGDRNFVILVDSLREWVKKQPSEPQESR